MALKEKVQSKYSLVIADEEMENEEQEESEDDIYLTPSGSLGSQLSVSAGGNHLGNFKEDEDAQKAIVDWINKNKWCF